jgi:hypothetical protein
MFKSGLNMSAGIKNTAFSKRIIIVMLQQAASYIFFLYSEGEKPVCFLKNLLKKNWSLKCR